MKEARLLEDLIALATKSLVILLEYTTTTWIIQTVNLKIDVYIKDQQRPK